MNVVSLQKNTENMEIRQLRYFIKSAELLNFTEAAKASNIAESTLSQQIKQKEDNDYGNDN